MSTTLQILLNDPETQAPLRIRPDTEMSDDAYFEFCAANPGVRIERTAAGEIVIMAPTAAKRGTAILL